MRAALVLVRYPSSLLVIALGAGIAAAGRLAPLKGALLVSGSLLALSVGLLALATDDRQTAWRWWLRAATFFLLGWARALSCAAPEEPYPGSDDTDAWATRPIRLSGIVTRPPIVVERWVYGTRFSETRFTLTLSTSATLDVVCRGDATVTPGSRLTLTGTWLPPRPPRHPGDRHRSPRIVVPNARNLEQPLGPEPGGLTAWLGRWRGYLLTQVQTLYDENRAGLLAALLLGDRRLLSPKTREAFGATGTVHLLAISGLHVGLIMYYVIRLPLPLSLATPLRLAFLIAFSLLSGGQPPVVRAALMLALHLGLGALRRAPTPLNTLGWTATGLLLWDPTLLFAPGFQLSFCGVFFLLTWGRQLTSAEPSGREDELVFVLGSGTPETRLGRRSSLVPPTLAGRVLRSGALAIRASLAAWAGTTPLVALHFQRVHPLSPLWTVLVAPLLPLILMGGIVSIACAEAVPPLARTIAFLVSFLSDLLVFLLRWGGDFPGSTLDVAQPTIAVVTLTYGALLLGLHRKLRRVGWICAALIPLWFFAGTRQEGHELWIFDVGSGDATMLRSSSAGGFLVDGGTTGDDRRAGESLLRAIRATGSRRLHGAFLTHGHADHARGLVALSAALPVEQLWVPCWFDATDEGRQVLRAFEGGPARIAELAAGDRVTFAGAPQWRIDVLHPHRNERLPLRRSTNDMSLALKISHAGHALLLLGDLEEAGLARLFASGSDLHADGLVVPHHGRWNALWRELVERVSPRFAVISGSGTGGADETRRRLKQYGLPTFATWRGGCVHVHWTTDGWRASYLR